MICSITIIHIMDDLKRDTDTVVENLYINHRICSSFNHSHYGSFETGHRHGGWSIYFQPLDLFQFQIIHIMDHLKLDIDTVVDVFIFITVIYVQFQMIP